MKTKRVTMTTHAMDMAKKQREGGTIEEGVGADEAEEVSMVPAPLNLPFRPNHTTACAVQQIRTKLQIAIAWQMPKRQGKNHLRNQKGNK
jgi:hypothetical protein